MNKEILNTILSQHKGWLEGNGGERADLSGAELREADLSGADLRSAVGLILLPVQDVRGYSFAHAAKCGEEWRIRAGCRNFSIDEALEHWGSPEYEDRERGDLYVYAVEWLKKKVAA